MIFATDTSETAAMDAKVLLIMFYDPCIYFRSSSFIPDCSRWNLYCVSFDFTAVFLHYPALRRESVTHVEPGCGFDPSRSYRVARKCVAAVSDDHPWRSVQCWAAYLVRVFRVVCVVPCHFGAYTSFFVRAVDRSVRCLDIDL